MFHPEPSLTWVPATREQVVAVIESINQPQVSIPGRPSQTVTGHLCSLRNANGTFSIYVALHVPRTGENVVYVHDRRQVTIEQYRDVEIEGLQFLESMGFMLDNLNFRNMGPEAQEQTLQRIPLFGGRMPGTQVAEAQPAAQAPPAPAAPQGPARTAAGVPAVSGTSLGIPAVASPAPPAAPAAPALGPRESAALARLLASF